MLKKLSSTNCTIKSSTLLKFDNNSYQHPVETILSEDVTIAYRLELARFAAMHGLSMRSAVINDFSL